MRFEVIESDDDWIVLRDGEELARFDDQERALSDIAERLRSAEELEVSYSLAMRYAARG